MLVPFLPQNGDLILSSLKIGYEHPTHPRISSFCVVVFVIGNVVFVHTTTASVCFLSCSEFFFSFICAYLCSFFLQRQKNRFRAESMIELFSFSPALQMARCFEKRLLPYPHFYFFCRLLLFPLKEKRHVATTQARSFYAGGI